MNFIVLHDSFQEKAHKSDLSLRAYITHCDDDVLSNYDITTFMQECIVFIKGSLRHVIFSIYFNIDTPLQNISFTSAREVTSSRIYALYDPSHYSWLRLIRPLVLIPPTNHMDDTNNSYSL